MECCVMTEQDQMAMIESKEEDIIADRKPKGIQREGAESEEDEEENYEVDLSENSLTLRKSAAFAIGRFAMIFNDDVWDALKQQIEFGLQSKDQLINEPAALVLGLISSE
jgi:hypothetical protein